jgi:cyclopropane-fatty-acyl-phospholipid synthase
VSTKGRLKSFRKLLAHAREILELDIGFRLWDGSTVPEDLDPEAFAIRLADENLVAALLRSPNLETLLNLWVSKRIDFENGDMFDLLARRPKVRTREIRKHLSKIKVFNALRRFLFLDKGGPWPLSDQPDEKPSDGSKAENRKNIKYHYDVSNAFYELFLDKQMVYTCGYCTDWDNDIDQLQEDKLEMICRKLRLQPGETLLDLGCGWGALALYAAANHGVQVTGITLSVEQVEYARAKAEALGLSERVDFELMNCFDVEGQFDKVSSIGLQEHIGIDNYPTYYATIAPRPQTRRNLSAPRDHPARQEGRQDLPPQEQSVRATDKIHLPRRRSRSHRQYRHDARTARLRSSRCGELARALSADLSPLA